MPLTDDERTFLTAFEDQTLAAFHHADHVRLAWLYLGLYPVPVALGRFCDGLRAFAIARGAPGLYHETITFAFFFLINERRATGPVGEAWDPFVARNLDLFGPWRPMLEAYYHPETLDAPHARQTFVLPDRAQTASQKNTRAGKGDCKKRR